MFLTFDISPVYNLIPCALFLWSLKGYSNEEFKLAPKFITLLI